MLLKLNIEYSAEHICRVAKRARDKGAPGPDTQAARLAQPLHVSRSDHLCWNLLHTRLGAHTYLNWQ